MKTRYKAKSLSGAERKVRQLQKEVDELRYHAQNLEKQIIKITDERFWLAKLASKTPLFDNPLHVWEVEKMRDEILKGRGYKV